MQKLALVLALGHRPELLVLDEPVASLDPIARREFLLSLMEITADEKHTVLFSTHITSDLERVASHVALLQDGRIRFHEELDALKDRVKRVRVEADRDLPRSFSVRGRNGSTCKGAWRSSRRRESTTNCCANFATPGKRESRSRTSTWKRSSSNCTSGPLPPRHDVLSPIFRPSVSGLQPLSQGPSIMGRKLFVVLRTWYTRRLNWIFGAVIGLMSFGLIVGATNPFKVRPQTHYRVQWTNHFLKSDRLTRAELVSDVDLSARVRGVQHLWIQNVIPNPDGRGYQFSRERLTREQLLRVLPHCGALVRLQLEAELEPDAWLALASVPNLQTLEFRNLGFTNRVNLRGFPPIPGLRLVDLQLIDWVDQIGHVSKLNPWVERVVVRDIEPRHRDGKPLDLSGMPPELREIMIFPAMEQTSDPPYIPKWRHDGTPTLSAGWKYSDISQELLGGLAKLPKLKKVWLNDIDVRNWGEDAARAALPGKQVEQVVTLQAQPSPFMLGAMPLMVFPLILATLHAGAQFAHPLSRTIPGYAAPHQWILSAYLLVPITLTTVAMRLSGATWLPAVGIGVFGTACMLLGMGYAHVARNPRHGNVGGFIPMGALFLGVIWFVRSPEALVGLMTGEWPVMAAGLGLAGVAGCAWFVARLPRMACRFEEVGLRNMFGHPFDGPGWQTPQATYPSGPQGTWTVRWAVPAGRRVLDRKSELCLLGTAAERSELIEVGAA